VVVFDGVLDAVIYFDYTPDNVLIVTDMEIVDISLYNGCCGACEEFRWI